MMVITRRRGVALDGPCCERRHGECSAEDGTRQLAKLFQMPELEHEA